jgi:hypothetical protein
MYHGKFRLDLQLVLEQLVGEGDSITRVAGAARSPCGRCYRFEKRHDGLRIMCNGLLRAQSTPGRIKGASHQQAVSKGVLDVSVQHQQLVPDYVSSCNKESTVAEVQMGGRD